MKVLTQLDALREICRLSKKHGLYINAPCYDEDTLLSPNASDENTLDIFSSIGLSIEDNAQFIFEGGGILLFDTSEDMDDAFRTLGKYVNYGIYVCICNPDGVIIDENT